MIDKFWIKKFGILTTVFKVCWRMSELAVEWLIVEMINKETRRR